MPLYKLLNHLIILNFLWSFGGYYNKISDYDIFYGDPHNLETTDKFLTYELITPLFSDYAFKHRAIYIPKNQKIKYNDKNVFEFPIGGNREVNYRIPTWHVFYLWISSDATQYDYLIYRHLYSNQS